MSARDAGCRGPPTSRSPRWRSCARLAAALIAAIAIKLDSRGPVLYRRSGSASDGQPFEMLKLRTMRPGSDPVGVGTAGRSGDARVTGVGRILRRFSLDELPNLVNVIRGEMAIVGPRATLPAQVAAVRRRASAAASR